MPRLAQRVITASIGLSVFGLAITTFMSGSGFPVTEPASAQTKSDTPPPSIVVSGSSEIHAEPDMAVVTVGATAMAETAQDAMQDVSDRLAAVIAGAKALGVADRDVQTNGLSLQPIYRQRRPNDDSPPEIQSYRAGNNVALTVRDLSKASRVLDSALANGANVMGGLRFGITDSSDLQREALAQATANARTKAEAMARGAGVTITSVLSINEESVSVPRAQADFAGRAALSSSEGAAAPPVESGDMIITARVHATYSI